MKTMPAGAFKVHCLAVMDEVQSKREAVLITKRGKPVAKLVPVEKEKDDIFGFLKGKGKNDLGDIVSPASARRSGAISIDPARHPRGPLAGFEESTRFQESAELQ